MAPTSPAWTSPSGPAWGRATAFSSRPASRACGCGISLALAAGSEKLTREEGCQYLTRVGLCAADYIDREVDASLSGGEVKRIEIATILARKSGLMIFDEPEAGIDLWSFAKLTETFKAIHQKREATLIVISHQERIIDLADEIVMIRDGKIAKHGPKDEIFPRVSWPTPRPGAAICRRGRGKHGSG